MEEPSGSGLLRHQPLYDGFVPSQGSQESFAEAIDRHIKEHFGPVEFVYHEIGSHLVGVHVYVVAPTEQRPYRTFVTSGMSELPMTVPEGHGISPYAELMLCLPADWPLGRMIGTAEDPASWPVRILKRIARLPHEYGTWIGEWHSVPNGDPAEPYSADSPFAGVVVTPMLRAAPEARSITVDDDVRIELLALIPLHPEELTVKLERGTDALIGVLDRGNVTELLEPDRPSYA